VDTNLREDSIAGNVDVAAYFVYFDLSCSVINCVLHDFFVNLEFFYGITSPKNIAEKKHRGKKRSQNTQNIPGTKNLSSDVQIQNMCLKTPCIWNFKKISISIYDLTKLFAVFNHNEFGQIDPNDPASFEARLETTYCLLCLNSTFEDGPRIVMI